MINNTKAKAVGAWVAVVIFGAISFYAISGPRAIIDALLIYPWVGFAVAIFVINNEEYGHPLKFRP